jgi:hypothetical protein
MAVISRSGEAERESWTDEAEGLKVSLAAASARLAQADAARARQNTAADLGMPNPRSNKATKRLLAQPSERGRLGSRPCQA